jgi:hypothetical protein
MKKKVIKFGINPEFDWIDTPKPSRNYIPEWYKKANTYSGQENKPIVRAEYGNTTIKHCIPVLDSFTSGYMVELWQDIEVRKNASGHLMVDWHIKPDVLKDRDPAGASTMPVPVGHNETHFIWLHPFSIEVPAGYSFLITHPFNRADLPYTTLSGIVDTDNYPMSAGNIPFFFKDDFEGIIPKGSPIFQVLPFKREEWVSVNDASIYSVSQKFLMKSRSVTHGFYKKFGWSRKSYE